MTFSSFAELLSRARSPRSFFLFILPLSIVLGTVLPDSAAPVLNTAGLALVQLIAFPAIPLVLSAVMISISNIFSNHPGGSSDQFRFARRFSLSLVLVVIFAAFLATLLSIYQGPGILSPDGKLSMGRYMLDSTDIRISSSAAAAAEQANSQFWLQTLLPNNLLVDASASRTLRVITGSILAGIAMSRLQASITKPLIGVLRSINSTFNTTFVSSYRQTFRFQHDGSHRLQVPDGQQKQPARCVGEDWRRHWLACYVFSEEQDVQARCEADNTRMV